MAEPILVACSATKAAWSTEFRAYARDHSTDLAVEVIVTVRALLQPSVTAALTSCSSTT